KSTTANTNRIQFAFVSRKLHFPDRETNSLSRTILSCAGCRIRGCPPISRGTMRGRRRDERLPAPTEPVPAGSARQRAEDNITPPGNTGSGRGGGPCRDANGRESHCHGARLRLPAHTIR